MNKAETKESKKTTVLDISKVKKDELDDECIPEEECVEKGVLTKLEICQRIGKGAYGMVWKVVEKRTRSIAVLKKCFDVFGNSKDAQRMYREIMYLRAFGDHENIVSLRHAIVAENKRDIYLTFDYAEADLLAVIRSGIIKNQPLQKKFIVYQLLKALKYIHTAEVVHRDIKPSNILLDENCHLRLCDFGLARTCAIKATKVHNPQHTEYVSTRWYRAIEILLGSTRYERPIDVWGLGCVFGELLISEPVFPGVSILDQIAQIFQLIGKPAPEDVERESVYASVIVEMLPPIKPISMMEKFPGFPTEAIHLLGRCLSFCPSNRCTVQDALHHPYLAEVHDPFDEPEFPQHLRKELLCLDFDDYQTYSVEDYRKAIHDFIWKRKLEARRLDLKSMTNPAKVVLTDHSECLPEPF